jgi:hypothetical protein
VTDITPKALNKYMQNVLDSNFDITNRASGFVVKILMILTMHCYMTCEIFCASKEVQDWLATNPKVDLVIGDMIPDCSYGLSQKLNNTKTMLYTPIPMMQPFADSFGIPNEGASVPDIDFAFKPPFNFMQRLVGNVVPLWWRFIQIIAYSFAYEGMFERHLGLKSQGSFDEMNRNLSLIMTNGDYIEDYARSFPPFVVKVPGIHVAENSLKPLNDVRFVLTNDFLF